MHQHRRIRPMRVVRVVYSLTLLQHLSGAIVQNSYFMFMDPALVYFPRGSWFQNVPISATHNKYIAGRLCNQSLRRGDRQPVIV